MYAKARAKEQWEGVSTDTLDEIRDIIDSQMEKSLGDVVFFHSYGISDHDCATFDEFYNLFKVCADESAFYFIVAKRALLPFAYA